MTSPATITVEDGLFELHGGEPAWIWAHTCSMPACDCRSALVVATAHGREALLERARTVHEAWRTGAEYIDVASRLDGVDVFHVDIDTVEAFPLAGGEPLVLADHPGVRAVVERLDGEVLDGIGRLWYRGKGWPDPVAQMRAAKQIVIKGWKPGELVAYDEALTGVRADIYELDGRLYEAMDLYCIAAGCTCGEVSVDVLTVRPRGGPHVGRVVLERSGAARMEPDGDGRERLAQVWAAFQRRHPRFRERLARRDAVMKEVGARIVPGSPAPPAAAKPKVGRNDPCPCGSGKKYKKCCGAA